MTKDETLKIWNSLTEEQKKIRKQDGPLFYWQFDLNKLK